MSIVPIFLPTPYQSWAYPSPCYSRDPRTEARHTEMMAKLDKIAEKGVSVSVIGGDILSSAERAHRIVSSQSAQYEEESRKLRARLSKVRTWRREREKRKDSRERAESRELYIAYKLSRRRWFRRQQWIPGLYVSAEMIGAEWDDAHDNEGRGIGFRMDGLTELLMSDSEISTRIAIRLNKPVGYAMRDDVERVYKSAKLLPSATLTIPVNILEAIAAILASSPDATIEHD